MVELRCSGETPRLYSRGIFSFGVPTPLRGSEPRPRKPFIHGFTPVAFWRRGKIRGFTFVELMLAVAILSIGIVAVMQAFSFSLKMTGLSADISSAALLAGDITEEARFKVKHNLIALSPATVEGESGKFKWNYIFEPQEEEKLYLFKLGLSWRSSGQEEAFNLVTYFKK